MSLYVCLGCFTVSRRKREGCCSHPTQGGFYAIEKITEKEARDYGWTGDLDREIERELKAARKYKGDRQKQVWVVCSKCGTKATAYSEYEAQKLLAQHDCEEGRWKTRSVNSVIEK